MQDKKHLVNAVLRDPVHFCAFGFGLGLLPFAPGTWGSLAGIVLWWLTPDLIAVQLTVALLTFFVGIWLCGESARRIGVHDHSGIVWDEIVGMYLVLLVLPAPDLVWVAVAFLLFRIMDIWKPWPIRDIDHRLRGGLGIMLDDVMAAVYAICILLLARLLL